MKKINILGLMIATMVIVINCSVSDSVSRFSDSASKSSDSVSSISKSLASISNSLSSSSGGGEKKAMYKRDVQNLVMIYIQDKSSWNVFREDLSLIAGIAGITDWERDKDTFLSIGQGLKKANITTSDLEKITLELTNTSPDIAKTVNEGYNSI